MLLPTLTTATITVLFSRCCLFFSLTLYIYILYTHTFEYDDHKLVHFPMTFACAFPSHLSNARLKEIGYTDVSPEVLQDTVPTRLVLRLLGDGPGCCRCFRESDGMRRHRKADPKQSGAKPFSFVAWRSPKGGSFRLPAASGEGHGGTPPCNEGGIASRRNAGPRMTQGHGGQTSFYGEPLGQYVGQYVVHFMRFPENCMEGR